MSAPVPAPVLEFNEEAHAYALFHASGLREALPSVTTVLKAVGLINLAGIPEGVLETARARGTRCHKAAQFLTEGTLDWTTVDEADKPYVDAYAAFLAEAKCEVLAQEVRLYHPVYRYAGTTDVIGYWQGAPCVVDLKTGDPALVCAHVQLSAYELCLRAIPPVEWLDVTPTTPIRRVSLAIRKDGSYTAHDHRDPTDARVWLAALTVYRAQQGRGR